MLRFVGGFSGHQRDGVRVRVIFLLETMMMKSVVLGCVVLLGVTMMSCCKQDKCICSKPVVQKCTIVAHRGFSSVSPENTLISMVKGCQAGADGCELDVYLSKDGHVVVMHDNDVERTTCSKGKLTEMTLAQIKKLDAGSKMSPEYKGEPVPTLEEVLKYIKSADKHLVVEIKQAGIVKETLATIDQEKMRDHVTIIAFNDQNIRDTHAEAPKLPLAWLYGDDKTPGANDAEKAKWIADKTQNLGAGIVDIAWKLVTPELVKECHARGIQVWAWTVDDPEVMAKLMGMGVDSITTNKPDLGLVVRKQQLGV
jgi:glycerophosphoryl diester phosphodiesterase